MDKTSQDVTPGSLFIRGDDTLIRVESVDGEVVIYRFIVTPSAAHLGKRDWAFAKGLSVGWEHIV